MRRFIFIVGLIFLLAKSAFAQNVAVEAFVDKPSLSLDDQLILTIRVKGANVFSEPRIPNRGNFDVLSRGSSSQIEMINGRLSVTKEYTYILGPRNTGTFEIGPISVEVEGVEYKAGPISVTVVSGEPSPSPGPPGFPGFPQRQGPPPPDPRFPSSGSSSNGQQYKDVFVTAEVDNKNPYVGQQVIFTFRLYTSRNVNSAKLDLPDFHDFWSEEVQKENKYYKELGGVRYVVSEFKVALFPTRAGALTIGESVLKAEVEQPNNYSNLFNDPFFNFRAGPLSYRPRVFKAPAITVEAKELPPGAPPNFTGLVGGFKLEANLSKKDLTVGETATLTFNVSGAGNIKDANLSTEIQVPNLKVYADKPSVDLKKSPQGISGTKTFKLALVPEGPGRMQIASLALSYFDPEKGTYETLSSPTFDLSVVPGTKEQMTKAQAAPGPQGVPVNPLAEDIATIHREAKLIHEEPSFEFFYVVLVLFAAPPLVFLISAFVLRRRRWKDANVELIKKRKALSRAVGLLKEIDLANKREIPARISHVLKEYLGDKLGVVGVALTPREVEQIFSKNGKKSAAGLSFARFLQDLDGWTYGGLPQEEGWETNTRKKAIGILKGVEREL